MVMHDAAEQLRELHAAGLSIDQDVVTESGESADAANGPGCACHGAKPPIYAPKYLHACYKGEWTLATWPKSDPSQVTFRTARCMSWRHEGPCRRKKASEDYARIKEALARHERKHVVYAVLTLDPSAWTGAGWTGPAAERRKEAVHDHDAIAAAYRDLGSNWTYFVKQLRERFGDLEYVETVECHKSGWPHLNVIMVCPTLANEVQVYDQSMSAWGRKARGRETANLVFGEHLRSSGFGPIAFLEPAMAVLEDGTDRLAGYIAKLAGDAFKAFEGEKAGGLVDSVGGQAVAEIVKHSQVPVIAPPHFRRLRSSKGFLPPPRRDESITGVLYDEKGVAVSHDPAKKYFRQLAQPVHTEESLKLLHQQCCDEMEKHPSRKERLEKAAQRIHVKREAMRLQREEPDQYRTFELPPLADSGPALNVQRRVVMTNMKALIEVFGDIQGPGFNPEPQEKKRFSMKRSNDPDFVYKKNEATVQAPKEKETLSYGQQVVRDREIASRNLRAFRNEFAGDKQFAGDEDK